MNLIKQPNHWTCAAACVCMLTNTTLDEFYAYCGHDGSEDVTPTKKRAFGKRCFSARELYGYLLCHDMVIGWGFIPSKEFDPKTCTATVDFEKIPALLDVVSTSDIVTHCVLWDGENIVDPYFPNEKKTVHDYTIEGWWPVTKLWEDDLPPLRDKP